MNPIPSKITFDPSNVEHLVDFRNFLEYNAWGGMGCKYDLEFPYLDIPSMCRDKVVSHFLKDL